jgi:DNA-binding CsgD family transcriptional regulator
MKTLDLKNIVYCNMDQESIDNYTLYYHKIDPIIQKSYLLPSVKRIEDVVSRNHFRRTEYYSEFLKKYRLEYKMSLSLRCDKSLVGGVALFRGPNSSNFSASDKRLAEMMVPYLSKITKKYLILRELESESTLLHSVINSLPDMKGIIIFNDIYELLYMDEYAKTLINAYYKDCSNNPPQGIDKIIECTKLYLRRIYNTDDWHNLTEIRDRIKMNLFDNKDPIDIYLRSIQYQGTTKCLCLFFESDTRSSSISRNMDSYQLTKREREIVYLILQGLDNIQISSKLFISRYTVENHLRSIFYKCSVSSRAKLMSRMIFSA